MQYLGFIAAGVLALGLAAQGSAAELKVGAGATTGALDNEDYHLGYGAIGNLAVEQPLGMMTETQLAIRGNYLNYQPEDNTPGEALDQAGVNLAALVGPSGMVLEPKVGGHVGYDRFEGDNFLDLGADVLAAFKITPMVELQATVTPTWLMNQDDTDYLTKVALGVQWTPGM